MNAGNDDPRDQARIRRPKLAGYGLAVLLEAAITAGLVVLEPYIAVDKYPLVYVVAIMAIAYWLGEGPAILAFVLGLLEFDYFFVPPIHTILPHSVSPEGWARFSALFVGAGMVAFAMVLIRRSQRRAQALAEELRESTEELAAIYDNAPLVMLLIDQDRRVRKANRRAEEFASVTAGEIVGQRDGDALRCLRALDDPRGCGFADFCRECTVRNITIDTFETGRSHHQVETVLPFIVGGEPREVTFLLSTSRLKVRGQFLVLVTILDITDRKAAEQELTESRKTLERHLSLLQQALVPLVPSVGEGYTAAAVYLPAFPGEQIGGDFYDVFTTERDQVAIVIGDVAGKGVEAAALAAAARSTIRSFAYELTSAGATISHANAVLRSQESESGVFVTVFLAIIDPSTGLMSYARAGHPPAAIWRSSGEIEFLEVGGPPIGVVTDKEYETLADCIGPGDKMILYTDGITEARRGAELFGLEGVRDALVAHGHATPDEIANRLLEAARDWAEGRVQDDVAILVVRRDAGEA